MNVKSPTADYRARYAPHLTLLRWGYFTVLLGALVAVAWLAVAWASGHSLREPVTVLAVMVPLVCLMHVGKVALSGALTCLNEVEVSLEKARNDKRHR